MSLLKNKYTRKSVFTAGFLTVVLSSTLFCFHTVSASTSWNVWLDHSIKKYRQNGEDGTNSAQSLTVKMAQNEFESFQIVVSSAGEQLKNVDVSVSNFTQGSHVIDDIYIFREHYIPCTKKSRIEFSAGSYPDPLLPKIDRFYHEKRTTFPFNVKAGTVQGIWVDIGTTKTTVPGIYKAAVTVTARGKKPINLPVTLQVWDFTLPSTASYPARFVAHASSITAGHGLGRKITNHKAIDLITTYNTSFLYHRVLSWIRGDGKSYEYTWDEQTKKLTIVNWDPWEKFYSDCIEGTAITSGPYAGARFPLVNMHRIEWVDVKKEIDNSDKQTALRQYMQQVYNHFEKKGWDPFNYLYVNVADEPKCNDYKLFRGQKRNACEIVKIQANDVNSVDTEGAGIWKNVYTHSYNTRRGLQDFADYGFYSPNFGAFACRNWDHKCRKRKPNAPRNKYPGYPNDRLWPYIACNTNDCDGTGNEYYSGQIDQSIDAPAGYNRLMSHLLWKYEGTGTVFWSVDNNYIEGTGDPYHSIWNFGSNGDGILLYPGITTRNGRSWPKGLGTHTPAIGGKHDIPIASMRWKYIRDWQEDLEYMKLASAKAGKNAVDTIVDTVFTNTKPKVAYWNLNINPKVILSVREKLANLITADTHSKANK